MLHKGREMPTAGSAPTSSTPCSTPSSSTPTSGKVGVMADPPRFVHFNGTIVTYRVVPRGRVEAAWSTSCSGSCCSGDPRRADPRPVDGRSGGADGGRSWPEVWTTPRRPVTYGSRVATQEWPIFREMIRELCRAPIMQWATGPTRIETLIRPVR